MLIRLAIQRREPFAHGHEFPITGAYEKLVGKLYGEVDLLPLELARSTPSEAQFLHRNSVLHKSYPPQKCLDEYGVDRYFRTEAGNLVMKKMKMTDSSQDKRGRKQG